MKYQVGDKVIIKNDLTGIAKNEFQLEWQGKIMTIELVYEDRYGMQEDRNTEYSGSLWSEDAIEKRL